MCGIVGMVDYHGRYSTATLQHLTQVMCDTLSHRGPDDHGLWTSSDGRVCLGHRRLSIIDLRPEGRQPMVNEDGRVAVTFNGEIYNFQQLRANLEAVGHRFRSRTDTEVLCHLFEDADPADAVPRLSGMFALATWRSEERELVMARDHFGKKPLYYIHCGAFLAFASELRALQVLNAELLGEIDPVAVQEYLLYQYVPAPRTIYRNVRKLEPGTWLQIGFDRGRLRSRRSGSFFRFEPRESKPERPISRSANLVQEAHALLVAAVRARLVADVPVGAFLSGGNDSSLVVAVMARELGIRPRTWSIGFANWPGSEHVAARQIARHLGADHHELLVESSAVDLLPAIVDALDEPNGDSSCLPVYLLCQFARREVTVVLSGDGGDEVFGGYDRYTQTIREASNLRRRLGWMRHHRRWWTVANAYFGERILSMTEQTLKSLVEQVAPEVKDHLKELHAVAKESGPVLHRLRRIDAGTYLPGAVLAKVDRMSMQFALEVRCPLLDTRLASWAQHLPADALNDGLTGKKLLKQLARRYFPDEIVDRPKQGFGIPPQCWSRERILDLADDLFSGPNCKLHAYLEPRKLREHLAGQRDPLRFNVYAMWELLVLEQWLRKVSEPLRRSSRPLESLVAVAV